MRCRTTFSHLMQDLFRQLDCDAPVDDAHDVYTLHFEGEPPIHVVRADAQSLDVICEAGLLDWRDAGDALPALLELNGFDRAPFAPCVALDRRSGILVVRARQPLATLDAAALIALLQCVRTKAQAVAELMERAVRMAPRPVLPRPPLSRPSCTAR